jgi:hypothetical protein
MGLYDHYQPMPAIGCPGCGALLDDFQGKDGPCALVRWQQGQMHPVGEEGDPLPGDPPPRVDLTEYRLPDVFVFYTWCECGRSLELTGFCSDGTWASTALGDASNAGPAVAAREVSDGWRQCSRCAEAWACPERIGLCVCPSCRALTQLG